MATLEWVKRELRANYAKATRAGRRAARTEPRAASAAYLADEQALRIELTNGASVTLPVRLIPGLATAAARDIQSLEILGRGGGLHWERLDLDVRVPALIASVFEGRAWMAELGRSGGKRSSPAKVAAARKNGRKGGRPRARSAANSVTS